MKKQALIICFTPQDADVEEEGVMWVHGTDIELRKVKTTVIHGEYIGICKGLEYGEGKNTYWAPEVIRFGELYHMYVAMFRNSRRLESPAIHSSLHLKKFD